MPFKYLDVPLSAKKLIINECMSLVEKIVARVRYWTSKLLSYSGRVQLIKRDGEYTRSALVAWDTLCLPKSVGGGELNILNFSHWNKAAILKLLWAT
ncbi:hypothetical protein H5410_023774 [Solanum commersonii]|uniref:Uncharacterized protein n=1 Tax=Solanum commersonii TaxID=4109 RepID=A0A9J5ZIU4_SOLCO|nr:hypothetical protein H5410_023774 [Solanum commersonii]